MIKNLLLKKLTNKQEKIYNYTVLILFYINIFIFLALFNIFNLDNLLNKVVFLGTIVIMPIGFLMIILLMLNKFEKIYNRYAYTILFKIIYLFMYSFICAFVISGILYNFLS